jgi:hypothetical protein
MAIAGDKKINLAKPFLTKKNTLCLLKRIPINIMILLTSLLAIMFTATLLTHPQQTHAQVVFTEDYESGNLNQWRQHGGCYDYSFTVVANPAGAGKVARVMNRIGDDNRTCDNFAGNPTGDAHPYTHRAELMPEPPIARSQPGVEQWWGQRYFVPQNYPTGLTPIVMQVIASPFQGVDFALRIDQNRRWLVDIRRTPAGAPRNDLHSDLGPVALGTWTNIVVRHKRSQGSDGYLQIWINDKLSLDYRGVTGQSSEPDGFWKHGIYISQNIDSSDFGKEVVLYFDDVKIATGPNQYKTVSPSGKSTGSSGCNSLNSTIPLFQGYAAAFNVFSSGKELLLTADCSSSQPKITIGSDNPNILVYNKGYKTSGTSWTPLTLTCEGQSISDNNGITWCKGMGTATLGESDAWFAAYTCQQISGLWKCGCRDQACTTTSTTRTGGLWQLQGIKR